MKNIVILISGSGTNLRSIYNNILNGKINATISLVIANKKCPGITFATEKKIPNIIISHLDYNSRVAYDKGLICEIEKYTPNYVVLAGFMRVLSPVFVRHFKNKLINIHPSLLPKYKGLNTHKRVIESSDKYHGSTVHLVDEEVDGGKPIAYIKLEIKDCDSAISLEKRIKLEENKLYPKVLELLASDKIIIDDGDICFDGYTIKKPLHLKF